MSCTERQFEMRPAKADELPAIVDLINKHSRAMHGYDMITVQETESEWNSPGFEPELDTRLAVDPEGAILGYAELWNTAYPHVNPGIWFRVDSDLDESELGDAVAHEIISWARERAWAKIELAPADARVILRSPTFAVDRASNRRLEAAGMSEDRRFYRMKIEFDGEPAAATVPDGYEVRQIQPADIRDTYLMLHEAFKDHFGVPRNRDPEQAFAEWKHVMIDAPQRELAYNLIAVCADGVVGASMNWPTDGAVSERAWVASLAVAREHRRKGIAEALLRESFRHFYREGKREAGLGVDATSLTNATALYERCGMHVFQTAISFVTELRAGVDYTNRG